MGEIDLAKLLAGAMLAKRPHHSPDPEVAREFAEKFPATFVAIVKAAVVNSAEESGSQPGWRPMATAPEDRRVLVDFSGAGPIVAYRDREFPAMWVRYLGYGKSSNWPLVSEDYALGWMDLPASSEGLPAPAESSAQAEPIDRRALVVALASLSTPHHSGPYIIPSALLETVADFVIEHFQPIPAPAEARSEQAEGEA